MNVQQHSPNVSSVSIATWRSSSSAESHSAMTALRLSTAFRHKKQAHESYVQVIFFLIHAIILELDNGITRWPEGSWERSRLPSGSELQLQRAPGYNIPPPTNKTTFKCWFHLHTMQTSAFVNTAHPGSEVSVRCSRGEVVGCCLVDLGVFCCEQGGEGPQGAASRPKSWQRHLLQLC